MANLSPEAPPPLTARPGDTAVLVLSVGAVSARQYSLREGESQEAIRGTEPFDVPCAYVCEPFSWLETDVLLDDVHGRVVGDVSGVHMTCAWGAEKIRARTIRKFQEGRSQTEHPVTAVGLWIEEGCALLAPERILPYGLRFSPTGLRVAHRSYRGTMGEPEYPQQLDQLWVAWSAPQFTIVRDDSCFLDEIVEDTGMGILRSARRRVDRWDLEAEVSMETPTGADPYYVPPSGWR